MPALAPRPLLLSLTVLHGCGPPPVASPNPNAPPRPQNVILVIGDGMGHEHVALGSHFLTGRPHKMPFESFPHRGEVTTAARNNPITDSAAAATAMATGYTGDVGAIALGDDGPVTTVLEYYDRAGKCTGLVSNVAITDATPAAFAAHVAYRKEQREIATQYLTAGRLDLILGGGRAQFPAGGTGDAFHLMTAGQALTQHPPALPVAGLFAPKNLPYAADSGDAPSLEAMARYALAALDRCPNGFFLMIENGLIDEAAHKNDTRRLAHEMIALSDTIVTIEDWRRARRPQNDTLVIVTADHETGGLKAQPAAAGQMPEARWSTRGHTGVPVPVYATGPGAATITRAKRNTDLFAVLIQAL